MTDDLTAALNALGATRVYIVEPLPGPDDTPGIVGVTINDLDEFAALREALDGLVMAHCDCAGYDDVHYKQVRRSAQPVGEGDQQEWTLWLWKVARKAQVDWGTPSPGHIDPELAFVLDAIAAALAPAAQTPVDAAPAGVALVEKMAIENAAYQQAVYDRAYAQAAAPAVSATSAGDGAWELLQDACDWVDALDPVGRPPWYDRALAALRESEAQRG